ncbi:MAG TPA: 2-dehydropantoate 2-reductase [Rhodocyclaceae bacterium]|nr:2-dehydropantoate 2-reductase [Rhodocyclaceae bacterium]
MKILILGAGGIGGYFGARLQDAGADVTFLVRPGRAAQLAADGLRVSSPFGDTRVTPKTVTAAAEQYDVIILSCKAYDLDSAVAAIAPAVGPHSVVLPLLNGLAHIDVLEARFGRERVLGGVAQLAVMLAPDGQVKHLNRMHRLTFGPRNERESPWLARLERLLKGAGVDGQLSSHIEQDMWDKLVFLATLAAATCTMRANVGEIIAAGGEGFILGLLDECRSVAAAHDRTTAPERLAAYRGQLTDAGSTLAASMLRDIERGGPTEGDHVIGDLIRRGDGKDLALPLLRLAYTHLAAYELRRSRAA